MVNIDLSNATEKYKEVITKGKVTAAKLNAGFLTDLVNGLIKKFGKNAEETTKESETDRPAENNQ